MKGRFLKFLFLLTVVGTLSGKAYGMDLQTATTTGAGATVSTQSIELNTQDTGDIQQDIVVGASCFDNEFPDIVGTTGDIAHAHLREFSNPIIMCDGVAIDKSLYNDNDNINLSSYIGKELYIQMDYNGQTYKSNKFKVYDHTKDTITDTQLMKLLDTYAVDDYMNAMYNSYNAWDAYNNGICTWYDANGNVVATGNELRATSDFVGKKIHLEVVYNNRIFKTNECTVFDTLPEMYMYNDPSSLTIGSPFAVGVKALDSSAQYKFSLLDANGDVVCTDTVSGCTEYSNAISHQIVKTGDYRAELRTADGVLLRSMMMRVEDADKEDASDIDFASNSSVYLLSDNSSYKANQDTAKIAVCGATSSDNLTYKLKDMRGRNEQTFLAEGNVPSDMNITLPVVPNSTLCMLGVYKGKTLVATKLIDYSATNSMPSYTKVDDNDYLVFLPSYALTNNIYYTVNGKKYSTSGAESIHVTKNDADSNGNVVIRVYTDGLDANAMSDAG